MIGHLRGKISDKRPNQVVVDVGGVGYEVFIPLSTFYALGELHQDVNLLIHTHVREDTLALYGFVTSREKQLFEVLLSASGVGPVLALKILSGMSVEELLPAIRAGDLARLTTIPGVGRKTAERIVVDPYSKIRRFWARRPASKSLGTHCDVKEFPVRRCAQASHGKNSSSSGRDVGMSITALPIPQWEEDIPDSEVLK
ncbi:MAG: Holliday junction branch migration protein RuvA, partial [Acidobacteriia bacterium]|nr:Holliday junction branch migration protein RuvA [Terriglobia bacterium]